MKSNFLLSLITTIIFLTTGCRPNKRFDATIEEREKYNKALNYVKNIREKLSNKELEPSAKQALFESADKIILLGDIEKIEKTLTYGEFLSVLDRTNIFLDNAKEDNRTYTESEFKKIETDYNKMQKKLKHLKPNELKDNLELVELSQMEKNSFLFLADQLKKYDLKIFLNKTLTTAETLPASYERLNQIINLSDPKYLAKVLEDIIESSNREAFLK